MVSPGHTVSHIVTRARSWRSWNRCKIALSRCRNSRARSQSRCTSKSTPRVPRAAPHLIKSCSRPKIFPNPMEDSDSVSYSGYATLVDVSLIISSIIRSHHPRSQPTGVYVYSTLRLSLMPAPSGQDTLLVALSHRGPRYEPTLE